MCTQCLSSRAINKSVLLSVWDRLVYIYFSNTCSSTIWKWVFSQQRIKSRWQKKKNCAGSSETISCFLVNARPYGWRRDEIKLISKEGIKRLTLTYKNQQKFRKCYMMVQPLDVIWDVRKPHGALSVLGISLVYKYAWKPLTYLYTTMKLSMYSF